MENFNGKTAVVTGAASGIGQALAMQLAKEGCALVMADLDGEGLTRTRQLLAGFAQPISVHVMDVSDREQFSALAEHVARDLGGADLLINNAGIGGAASFLELPEDMIERFMQVNFLSAVYGCKAFLPQLLAKPEAHIVNVSSIEGIVALPGKTAYASSKFALRGFTEVLKLDLRKTSVKVSCVFPGGVKTNIARNAVREAVHFLDEHPDQAPVLAPRLAEADAQVAAFEAHAGTSAEDAASAIIDGIKKNRWRILIGEDAKGLDELQRAQPEAYQEILSQIWPKGLGPEW